MTYQGPKQKIFIDGWHDASVDNVGPGHFGLRPVWSLSVSVWGSSWLAVFLRSPRNWIDCIDNAELLRGVNRMVSIAILQKWKQFLPKKMSANLKCQWYVFSWSDALMRLRLGFLLSRSIIVLA